MNELLDVCVNSAPFLDRVDDGSEIVVGQHHVGRFLGHIGAGDSHGNSDVRHFYCGRVVHPVPGHGHDLSLVLERFDDAKFMFR